MRRTCYQCDDDLDAITDARNAEIRAWGRQVLADADALVPVRFDAVQYINPPLETDWDQIQEEEIKEIEETAIATSKVPKAPKSPKAEKPPTS